MGFLLLLPFLLVRFGLLSILDKGAVGRAAHFAPLTRQELPAYWLYQLSNVGILLYPICLSIHFALDFIGIAGIAIYFLGLVLLCIAMVNFAAPTQGTFQQSGLYRISRNPMYLAYFVYFLGCVLLTRSPLLLALLAVFQTSAHWIILAEERWCIQTFGAPYVTYMQKTRRYL